MKIESTRATKPMAMAVMPYWMAMILASWLQMYLPMKVFGW